MAINDVIVRGDAKRWYMTFTDGALGPLDLSGCTIYWTLKAAVSNDLTDADALIKHYIVISSAGAVTSALGFTLGGVSQLTQLSVSTAAAGTVTHKIPASASTLLAPGAALFDVQVIDVNGDPTTFFVAEPFTTIADVTRRITTP